MSTHASHTFGVFNQEVELLPWQQLSVVIEHVSAEETAYIERVYAYISALYEQEASSVNFKQLRAAGNHGITLATLLANHGADAQTIAHSLVHELYSQAVLPIECLAECSLNEEMLKTFSTVFVRIKHKSVRSMFRTLCAEGVKKPALFVACLADQVCYLHTLQSQGVTTAEVQKYASELLTMYVPLARQLSCNVLATELAQTAVAVAAPQVHSALQTMATIRDGRSATVAVQLQSMVSADSTVLDVQPDTLFRSIQWSMHEQCVEQLERLSLEFTIVCSSIEACHTVADTLESNKNATIESLRDYTVEPEKNGEQALRLYLRLEDGTLVHCRLCTPDMYSYSRIGVAQICFDPNMFDFESYLPWLQSLEFIVQSTQLNDTQCWRWIHQDVLQATTMVQSSDGHTLRLPSTSTVLDAALALYAEQALYATDFTQNGQSVAYGNVVQPGSTIAVMVGSNRTVTSRWYQAVHTFANRVLLQSALGKASLAERTQLGMALLQRELTNRNQGFLEELDERSFVHTLEQLEYKTLDELYIALADGYEEPNIVYTTLFEPEMHKAQPTKIVSGVITDKHDVKQIEEICRKYESYILRQKLHSALFRPAHTRLTLHVRMPQTVERYLLEQLRVAGLQSVTVKTKTSALFNKLAVITMIVAWGLHPVFAYTLVREPWSVSAIDFTILRFTAFFTVCAGFYLYKKHRSTLLYKPLPTFDWYLLFAAIFLVVASLSPYYALQYFEPHEGMTFVLASMVLTPFGFSLYKRSVLSIQLGILSVIIVAFALAMLWYLAPAVTILAYIASIGVTIGLLGFNVCLDICKRRRKIALREPGFVLYVSGVTLAICGMLLPFSTIHTLGFSAGIVFVHGICITGIPYILCMHIMATEGLKLFGRYCIFSAIITVLVWWLYAQLTLVSVLPLTVLMIAMLIYINKYNYSVTRYER